MSVHSLPQIPQDEEAALVDRARQGDRNAVGSLLDPWRKPLFGYIYRMVTLRQDAEDLLQDVLVRVLENIRGYRGEARFKSWVFGIATHVCLDHLRSRKRWRVEAQLLGEKETDADPEKLSEIRQLMHGPEFHYEIREHIAFCFSCISRTLPPEEQAAVMLREVLGFTSDEAASILGVSEPVCRHRLSAARAKMIQDYDGLCALINKSGICYQCRGLQEAAGEGHRGADLVQIQVAPGVAVNYENLFDARLGIVRGADLEDGRTRAMHDLFFENLSQREESR
ncbi:MAG TPA: RNA polymerase sigma factor [Candidatus Sulfotelmatobacter sp.]|jgi:RNA polymerase sigma-70 factor (ECF subfamily)|nr:RNA polymerase sigma factor [Candidatus Sulfotelmatobacter sp.]